MADTKISALPASTTPLVGAEVLPIVQSGATKQVSVANLTAGRDTGVRTLAANTTLSAWVAPFDSLVELKDGVSMTSAYGIGFNPVNAYVGAGGWLYRNSSVASLYQNGAGTHEWSRAASGTAGTAVTWISQLKTDSSDNVIVPTGNLVIGTSGKGIDFSATPGTGTSELLSDYEEGTWTPVFVPGSGSITTQTCTGRYTKIGRVVTVQFSIVIDDVGTGVGSGSISGLPFTSANTTDVGSGAVREYNSTGLEWNFTVNPNATTMFPARYDNTNTIGTGWAWRGSVTYMV
jgi:hypothetical protein